MIKQESKNNRILGLYTKLLNGEVINKAEEAARYHVNEKSIQRDIEDIREYLEEQILEDGIHNRIIYDRKEHGYRIDKVNEMMFTNSEVLALCKILLGSRAFTKKEMIQFTNKMVHCCIPKENQKMITELIEGEMLHYVELMHGVEFIDCLWDFGKAIKKSRKMTIEYEVSDKTKLIKRTVRPVSIIFSEYYFYLAAFIDHKAKDDVIDMHDLKPTLYRIDKIKKYEVCRERYKAPYRDSQEEGEFRKRIQFMYGGELQKVRFTYHGESPEAVLDRLPAAKIIHEENGTYLIEAETYGDGIYMWLRSHGNRIQILDRKG